MTLKSEVKACLLESMSSILDPPLQEHGFKRSRSGLLYKRVREGATQTIEVAFRVHPKDRPDTAASVYPFMEVLVPPVDGLLKDMIGGDLGLLAGVTRGTSRQPIDITSAKQALGRWFLFQPESVPEVVVGVRDFLEEWTVPLLDFYTNADAIVIVDEEKGERRVMRDRAQMMRVVAAALVCGRKSYAQALLDKWLGAPVPRRRYRRVFEYVERAT